MCTIVDETCDVWLKQERRAAKEHQCYECGARIPRGERYRETRGLYDGHWSVYRTHLACEALRDFVKDVVCETYDEDARDWNAQILMGGLVEELQPAWDYIEFDFGDAWEDSGHEFPANAFSNLFDEIRAHYSGVGTEMSA